MSDPAVVVAVLLGFALLILGASWLGAGSTLSLQGLWARPAIRDWPQGVQEDDAPRFSVDHLDGLRPGAPMLLDTQSAAKDDEPQPEIVELVSRRVDRAR
jgi:hypothetical protein